LTSSVGPSTVIMVKALSKSHSMAGDCYNFVLEVELAFEVVIVFDVAAVARVVGYV